MGSIRVVAGVLICSGSLACSGGGTPGTTASPPESIAATPRKASLPLACEGGSFSRFRLKNTRARTYEPDTFSGRSCELTDKAEGVIWVATGEGHALEDAEKKLLFRDDQGRQLGHTCWTSSGTINGVAQTELILFGPPDSRQATVCCGNTCGDVEVQ